MTATEGQLLAEHFPIVLTHWVMTLPSDGFRGSVRKLWDSLFIVQLTRS